MVSPLGPGIGIAVIVIAIVVYVVAMRTSHHYTSLLTCPHCQRPFEYRWVPLASFTAVRLGNRRYLQCPLCRKWDTFDIWSARTEEPKT